MGRFSLRARFFIKDFWGGKIHGRVWVDIRAYLPHLPTLNLKPMKRTAVAVAFLLLCAKPAQHTFFVDVPRLSYRADAPRTVLLQDGSTVLLNKDAEITAEFTRSSRQIILSRGEAIFSVSHHKEWPFVVTAGETTVQAVGTAFSVRIIASDQVDVLVTQGRVEVATETQNTSSAIHELRLTQSVAAGRGLTIRGVEQISLELRADEINRRLRWTKPPATSGDRPLVDVVRQINQFSETQLEISDPALMSSRIGGTFVVADPYGFAGALSKVVNISASPPEKLADGRVVIRLHKARRKLHR